VRGEASRIINESYAVIENEQEKMFNKLQEQMRGSLIEINAALERSSNDCKRSAKIAREAMFKLWELERWRDYLQYVTPAALLLNLIFRILQQFVF